jgi:retron-type reverse transcriptase
MNVLESKIQDQRFLQLIRKSLNAGYFEFKVHKTSIVGIPQGSIISPILANIYLHQLDLFILELKEKFDYIGNSNLKTSE